MNINRENLKLLFSMKAKLISRFDKILMAILSIFGMTSCGYPVAEYGVPYADFEINGTVTDSVTSQPIKNIRVIRQFTDNPNYGDTVLTDASGKYKVTFTDFPVEHPDFILKVEDTDGELNGGNFVTREISAPINSADWIDKENSGWYAGKAVKTVNIKLKPKQ